MLFICGILWSALLWAGSEPAKDEPRKGPAQPLAFSHKTHSKIGIECEVCHRTAASSEKMSLPAISECLRCHQGFENKNPALQKLGDYQKQKREIPWVRIYQTPDYVSFSHVRHTIAKCQVCHGPVQERVTLWKEGETSMNACVACHKSRQASIKCNLCHEVSF